MFLETSRGNNGVWSLLESTTTRSNTLYLLQIASLHTNMRNFFASVVDFFVFETTGSSDRLVDEDGANPPVGITQTFHINFWPAPSVYLYDNCRQSPQAVEAASVVPTTTRGSSNRYSASFPMALRTKKT